MKDADANSTVKPTTAVPNPQSAQDDQSRRLPRRWFLAGGFFSLLGQGCSTSEFGGSKKIDRVTAPAASTSSTSSTSTSTRTGTSTDTATATGTDTGNATESSTSGDTSTSSAQSSGTSTATAVDQCKTTMNPSLNVDKITNAAQSPTAVFYGRQQSTLLAIQLPASAKAQQVIVCNPNGKLLAIHGISSADKASDGSWRPIVIDNLSLTEQGASLAQLYLITLVDGALAKSLVDIKYFSTFQGKPVIDLGSQVVPSDLIGNQSVARFQEVAASFNVDANTTYNNKYDSTIVRNLHTAKSTTTWVKQAAVLGTVTDIMGNVINIDQAGILEYQVFCTYVDTGKGTWARTMLLVG